ncbi:putative repeat protein (TIGR02543 family) [Aneurinibacillus soli]|uniref:Endo-1,4-beta-xylanase A n=3 Tax=Aneurinibacillus soli TaxID=1500254 RepID=A0A0U5BGI9_9BACL|nr:putative repeat protein (TIGR02543 family) [Aneurinibacillus soli]BAU29821.1 Endo-1,4-beta-xylanase A precursor [Aneurinibacillus soli]
MWSSRSGRIALACLLTLMLIPFMGAGNVVHATSPTWAAVGQTVQPLNVQTLLKAGGTLYAGTGNFSNDVWSNSNGTWTQMIGSPSYVRTLLVDANGTLYAGAWGDGNNVSTYTASGGWAQMSGSPGNVYALLEVNGTLYAGTSNGSSNDVWMYSNGTWMQMNGSPGNVYALLEVNGTLYAGTFNGSSNDVWTYSNGTWTQMTGSPGKVTSLAEVGGTLYVGNTDSKGVWTYSNGTWKQMSGSPRYVKTLLNINGTLYVGTASGYGYDDIWTYTTSGGWTHTSGSPGKVYSLLDVNGTLYAGTQNGSNDVWTNSNGAWTQMGGVPRAVTTLLGLNGTLYAGTSNSSNAVWSYSNGTWTQMSGSPSNVTSLVDVNGTLYTGTSNDSNDVWSYSNGTWTQMSGSPSNVTSLVDVNGTLYTGTSNGSNDVWSYSNGTWTQMSNSPSNVTSLVDVNGTLYTGTSNGSNDVWSYSNGTWTQMSGSPSNVHSMIDVNGTLYAGTTNGSNAVWSYSNGTWTQLNGSPSNVHSMIDVNGTLYAGTTNGSNAVWSYSNGTWEQVSGSPSQLYSFLKVNSNIYAGGWNGVEQLISLGAPVNLQASSTTSASTTLSWDAVSGATGYYIYENGGNTAIATVTSATYTVNGLAPNTSYTFTASAFDAAGESAQSGAINVQTLSTAATLTSTIGTVSTGGTANESITNIPYGTTLAALKAAITPEANATFEVYDADGTTVATALTTGNKVIVTAQDGTTVTYTVTVIPAYTVTYNGNGATSGNAPTDSGSYAQGATVSVYENTGNLVKTGYTFAGWNTQADGNGTTYATGTTFSMATANVTLYAKWTENPTANPTYTVTYNGNGNSGGSAPTDSGSYAQGVTVSVYGNTGNLVKTGYTFAGWNTQADGNGTTYAAGTTFSMATANVTLYAKWTENPTANPTYTVTYNGNGNSGGSAPTDSGSYAQGVTVSVYGNTGNLVKTGYTFAGWNTQADGNGTTYAAGTTFSMATANVTLYAKWTANNAGSYSSGGGGGSIVSTSPVTSTDGTLTLPVGRSGEVSLQKEVTVSIPTGATDKELKITIEKLLNTQNLITDKNMLAGPIFEILKNFSENFNKPATLTFAFDKAKLSGNQTVAVCYFDEVKKEWVEVPGGKINENHITVQVDHFTKYAVFVVGQGATVPTPDMKPTINFSDISGHWSEANIKQAVSSGIVSGYPDGTFKPNSTVTRAEFAVMLMNTLKPQGEGAVLTFTDTAKIDAWAQKAVAQAVQAGIINGYEDGTFRPDAEITRPEMAAMIANTLGQSIKADTATGFADDKDIPTWAKGAVAAMKKLGIIEGKGTNEFAPGDKTTRAEAVTVLLKMLAHKEQVK